MAHIQSAQLEQPLFTDVISVWDLLNTKQHYTWACYVQYLPCDLEWCPLAVLCGWVAQSDCPGSPQQTAAIAPTSTNHCPAAANFSVSTKGMLALRSHCNVR